MPYIGKQPAAVPVTAADIPDNSITAAKIVDGAITIADIADDAVTADKLANSINSAIAANTAKTGITSGQASAITANTAKTGITSGQASAITANTAKVTNSTSASDLTSGTLPSARLGTITGFTSTGIDDNATSNVVTIASNNRVDFAGGGNAFGIHLKYNAATSGVYLGSPSNQAFQVSSASGTPYLNIDSSGKTAFWGEIDLSTSGNKKISFRDADDTFRAGIQAVTTGGQMIATSAANDFAIRSQSSLLFSTGGNTERLRIDSSGIVDTLYKIKQHNGTNTHTERFHLSGYTAYTFDITVPSEGGSGNSFLVNCGFNHYYVTSYGAHHSAWYSTRGTGISQVLLLGNQTSGNGGAWSVSKPNATTLRITKSAGTYSGGGAGFLQVIWSGNI